MSPEKICSSPGSQNFRMTVFENRIIADVTGEDEVILELDAPPKNPTVLIKRGDLDTDRHTERTTCEEKGRGLEVKECQRLPANHQKLWSRLSLPPSEGAGPDDALVSDF